MTTRTQRCATCKAPVPDVQAHDAEWWSNPQVKLGLAHRFKPQQARIQVRRGTYRGVDGWRIVGKDQQGRQVSIFSTTEQEARRMAADIKAGTEPVFDAEVERRAKAVARFADMPMHDLLLLCDGRDRSAAREALLAAVQRIADKLRETASGLRAWDRNRGAQTGVAPTEPPVLHPFRAAQRLDQMAEQISSTKSTEGEKGK